MTDTVGPLGSESRPPPSNILALIDKHLTRATETREMLIRYAFLMFVFIAGAILLIVGIACSVEIFGMRLTSASGLAVGGVSVFLAAMRQRQRKSVRSRENKTSE
jgi:small neutral amino acid transporter SnatA (MarC family)